jgi:hypothetical protein
LSERRLAVVHLVWGPLGPRPLRDFVRAYRRFAAGVAHELIVVFNGVGVGVGAGEGAEPGAAARAPLLRELESVEHRLVELERPVLDLAAYFAIAECVPHERLCFLNSYSEPLLDGWLALLAQAASDPGVGMAGATGSWASQSSHVRYLVGLGGPYSGVYGDRASTKRVFAPSSPADGADPQGGTGAAPGAHSVRKRIRDVRMLARQLSGFPAFPATHLRTNAFVIDRELMRRVRPGGLDDKTDTYLLESGRRSLTRQVQRMGHKIVVVGRDGVSYEPRDWARSNTFWQGSQENLIVADNQTRSYERGDLAVRRALSAHAWGKRAAPAEPDQAG